MNRPPNALVANAPVLVGALIAASIGCASCSSPHAATAAAPTTASAPVAPSPSGKPGCTAKPSNPTAEDPSGIQFVMGDLSGGVIVTCAATTPDTTYGFTVTPVREGAPVDPADSNVYSPVGGAGSMPVFANAACVPGTWTWRSTVTIDGVAQTPVDGPTRTVSASDCGQ